MRRGEPKGLNSGQPVVTVQRRVIRFGEALEKQREAGTLIDALPDTSRDLAGSGQQMLSRNIQHPCQSFD